jgi:hypothetical protein
MVMKKIIIFALAVLLAAPSFASHEFTKAGTAGAQFLKVGVGARYHGLGEASVAVADNIYAMYWNPAGLALVRNSELAFTHVNYVMDVSLDYVAYAKKWEDWGVFGISATVLSMGNQEITTVLQPEGTGETYDVSSYAFQLTYARNLTANFSIGGSFKYIGEKIYREKAGGFAFDFGTMLYTGLRSLRLGMNISNLGPEMKFSGPDLEVGYDPGSPDPSGDDTNGNPNWDLHSSSLNVDPYDLPLTFRIGMAYDFQFGNKSIVTLALEAKHPNDNLQQGSIGAEFNWNEHYFLRAGYKLNYEEEGLGLGGGFRTNISGQTDLVLDYAWVDFGRFNSVHRFSACLAF